MTSLKSRRIAKTGEQLTAEYLENQGYTLLERNWRWSRYAELDLIARGPDRLTVFVEVKTRTCRGEVGIPLDGFEAVNWAKQKRIIRAARSYLRLMGYDSPARFDVAVVTVYQSNINDENPAADFIYVEGAFAP